MEGVQRRSVGAKSHCFWSWVRGGVGRRIVGEVRV